jgi:hypothetical protein
LATFLKTSYFSGWHFIKFVEPWVRYMHTALGAVNTRTIKVVWYLMCSHRVFLVTTPTVSMNARHSVSLDRFQQTFALSCSNSTRNTIWRNDVDPDYAIRNFESAFDCRGVTRAEIPNLRKSCWFLSSAQKRPKSNHFNNL